MSDDQRIKARYRRFAENECKGYSDLYFRLAHAVADDDELTRFIAPMPVIQPNLFLASIQFAQTQELIVHQGNYVQEARIAASTNARPRPTR
jgi:hypothetical protein